MLFYLCDYGVMTDRAGSGKHHVGPAVMAAEIIAQLRAVERPYRHRRAENGPAERLVGKGGGLQVFEDEIVGGIGDCTDLLHNDILLQQEIVAGECRFGENVGKDVDRQRHVGFEHASEIGRAFDARRGIKVSADGLDLFGDLPGGPPPRSLERHMFEEMRDAVLVVAFVTAAGIDPHAERGGLQVRHGVGNDIDAGFQFGHRNAHAAAPSCAARLVVRTKRSTAD